MFCEQVSAMQTWVPLPDTPAPLAVATADQAATSVQSFDCGTCGISLSLDAKFCYQCGTQVQTPPCEPGTT